MFNFLQSQFLKENFTELNGVSSNEVHDFYQDKNGYIWFATDRGLTSFNGVEFKKYGLSDGLPDISVLKLFPQKNGQIWGYTFSKKLFYFENGINNFIPYKYNDKLIEFFKKSRFSLSEFRQIEVFKNDEIIISTVDFIFKISSKGDITVLYESFFYTNTFSVKELFFNQRSFLVTTDVSLGNLFYIEKDNTRKILYRLNDDLIIVLLDDYFYIYNEKSKAVKKVHFLGSKGIRIGHYDEDSFWIGFRSCGFNVYDFQGNIIHKRETNYSVTSVNKDLFNCEWITTLEGGIFSKRNTSFTVYNDFDGSIYTLTKNNKNQLFFANSNGKIYLLSEGKCELISNPKKKIFGLVEYVNNGKDIVYSSDMKVYLNDSIIHNSIPNKISDDDGESLYLSCFNFYKDINRNKISEHFLYKICDITEINNQIYLATIEGLKKIKNNKEYSFKHPFLNVRMEDIDYDLDTKNLYIATVGRGVIIYNLKTNRIQRIDKTNGLSDDIVTEVYLEGKDTLWACTNYGLNRLCFENGKLMTIDYITSSDGLKDNQIKDVEVINDEIFIGTASCLSSIKKNDFEKLLKKRKYFFRLEKLLVNGNEKKILKNKTNVFKYNENRLDFYLDAINPSRKKNLEFKYCIEGLDQNWYLSSERKISYEFIPPGNYKLKIYILEDGKRKTDEIVEIKFIIQKPFTRTVAFFLILVTVLLLLIYGFFRFRILIYNRDLVREFLRYLLKKIKRNEMYLSFRESGNDVRIKTSEILYINASGNYLDINTLSKTYTIRCKIGDFMSLLPDPIEFLRIHRSYIIRIDKVSQKNKKTIFINGIEIPVGEKYSDEINKILF